MPICTLWLLLLLFSLIFLSIYLFDSLYFKTRPQIKTSLVNLFTRGYPYIPQLSAPQRVSQISTEKASINSHMYGNPINQTNRQSILCSNPPTNSSLLESVRITPTFLRTLTSATPKSPACWSTALHTTQL